MDPVVLRVVARVAGELPNPGPQLKRILTQFEEEVGEKGLLDVDYNRLVKAISELPGLKYLDSGRHRSVFEHRDWVIKVPLSDWGVLDNTREALAYKKDKEHLARCRMLSDLLVMEKVVPYTGAKNKLPKWVDYIDCGQVGYNREGKLVAFDYAD
jgi:hypothetical protein